MGVLLYKRLTVQYVSCVRFHHPHIEVFYDQN